jgi:glycosyltransferase involved in cell wall biosynthesis
MSTKDLVSVIIPTYNRADKIRTAVESAINQSYRPVELIVVDDGSSDNTKEVLKNYSEVHYIWQTNRGQAAARNFGLRNATGEFIASLDSDDSWNVDFIEICLAKLKKDNLDFVFANWKQQLPNGQTTDFLSGDTFLRPHMKNSKDNWFNLNDTELRRLYLRACPSPSSSGVIRRSSIVSGWNEQINIGDDWCLYLDMILSKKCAAAFTMDQLWNKQINANNIYDGRSRDEVLQLLYINDMQEFLLRYQQLLTKGELSIITKRYIRGLVELAKHNAIRDFNFSECFKLMRQSARVNPFFTLLTIPDVLAQGLNRHIKKFRKKINIKSSL